MVFMAFVVDGVVTFEAFDDDFWDQNPILVNNEAKVCLMASFNPNDENDVDVAEAEADDDIGDNNDTENWKGRIDESMLVKLTTIDESSNGSNGDYTENWK